MRLPVVARAIFAGLLCLTTAMSPAMATETTPVKLGLELLNEAQKKELVMQVFYAAYFEARLENCGFRPDFERRVAAAVSACIKPESLASLVSLYRRIKEDGVKSIAEDRKGPSRINCASKAEQAWLKGVRQTLENNVTELQRMCRSCTIC
jgi:hypothetical protein